jgi:hypothetical protein
MLPRAMGGASKAKACRLLSAAVLALLLAAVAAGCGGSGGDEVTVLTGSLSKAKFIEKADAICKAARTEFLAKFTRFAEAHKAELIDQKAKDSFVSEVLESLLAPNIEGQVRQISQLGAPHGYAAEVATFLDALEERVEEGRDDPGGLLATPTPFKRAEDTARKIGMYGCAESFA